MYARWIMSNCFCSVCLFRSVVAVQVCSETYGLAPEVVVSGDRSARVPYLTSHLDYMVYELLKNSMRAGEGLACRTLGWSHGADPSSHRERTRVITWLDGPEKDDL